jgi:hypothetical protein
MSNTNLTPYETLELRELLNTEVVSFKRIHASISMAQDEELESFMKRSLESKKKSVGSIRDFINSSINTNTNANNNNNNNNNANSANSTNNNNTSTSGK